MNQINTRPFGALLAAMLSGSILDPSRPRGVLATPTVRHKTPAHIQAQIIEAAKAKRLRKAAKHREDYCSSLMNNYCVPRPDVLLWSEDDPQPIRRAYS